MWNRTNLLLLITGMGSFVLLGLANAIFGAVLPVYADRFGLPISTVGWLLSMFWGGCLGGVGAVYLMPLRTGPKTGLILSGAGTALMASVASWPVVLAGGALFGAGYGVIAAVYNPRVLAAFGPKGPAMMSLLNAIFTIGAIASPQVFLALGSDLSLTFTVFTGFTAAILALALPMGSTQTQAEAVPRPITPDWWILGFAALGIGMESSLIGLGPTALVIAGETEAGAAQLLSYFFVTYLAARVSLIFLAHRVRPFGLYVFAWALTGTIAAACVWGDAGFWFPMIGFACGLFFHSAFLTGMLRMGSSTRVSAVMLAAGLVGAILQPMIIAQVLGNLGPKGFFQIALGLAVVLTLTAALSLPRMRR